MAERWTRNQIMEMGLVAMQAGVESPEQLMDLISKGMKAEWRLPLVQRSLRDAQAALQGWVD